MCAVEYSCSQVQLSYLFVILPVCVCKRAREMCTSTYLAAIQHIEIQLNFNARTVNTHTVIKHNNHKKETKIRFCRH